MTEAMERDLELDRDSLLWHFPTVNKHGVVPEHIDGKVELHHGHTKDPSKVFLAISR